MPVLQLIKQEYLRFPQLSNDELRDETVKLKLKIRDYIKAEEEEIESLKAQAESGEIPIEEGEKLYDRVDKLEEIILKKIEEARNNISHAAELLGLERSHLYRKMKALGIGVRE